MLREFSPGFRLRVKRDPTDFHPAAAAVRTCVSCGCRSRPQAGASQNCVGACTRQERCSRSCLDPHTAAPHDTATAIVPPRRRLVRLRVASVQRKALATTQSEVLMNPDLGFAVSIVFSFITWGLVAKYYLWPVLKTQPGRTG